MTDELIGMRSDDLEPELRREQKALLETPALEADHRDALALGARLAALPSPRTQVTAAQALARRRPPARAPRMPYRVVGGAIALAAAMLLTVVAWPGARDRGVASAGTVHLQAAAESPAGTRALHDGDVVHAGERVVFRVDNQGSGSLVLDEIDGSTTRIWPAEGQDWSVQDGHHTPGTDAMLSWRTDRGPGTYAYRARMCAGAGLTGPCVDDQITLRWEP